MSKPRVDLEYQERDLLILRDLFVSRIMTLAHITALHFDGRSEAAKKRLQKLKSADFVGERPRKARDPGILFLAKNGFELLRDGGHLSEFPTLSEATFEKRARVSDLTLRHELEVMDAKAALAPAIGRVPGFSLVEFSTWPMLYQFDVRPRSMDSVRVKPDGLIRVREQADNGGIFEHSFFLEVDRGTETLDTLGVRAICYRDYYTSGGYAESFGAPRTAYAEYPFRVLMVFPSDERRNNIAERLLLNVPPIETQVWLTTAAELSLDPLGAIWIRPRDYRDAAAGTPFEVRGMQRGLYRRQPDRESHIQQHIVRCALFANE